ncbi:MAG: ATP-binding cassette domain-containing protein, partial [Spirochaetia bacterium]
MRNVSVTFSRVEALHNACVTIRSGKVLGILGNGGAGKTTLVKALVGLVPIESGEIYLDGQVAGFRSPADTRKHGIEVMYQDLALLDHLSIARNFFAGREPLTGRRPFRRLVHRDLVRWTDEIFDRLGMSELPPPDFPVSKLSGAQRQLLAVARAVHFATRVLILDEPTASLSDNQVDIVLSLIDKARNAGIAVVFVTHKAYEVFSVADEFVVVDKGRTIVESRREETSLKELE